MRIHAGICHLQGVTAKKLEGTWKIAPTYQPGIKNTIRSCL